MLVILLALFSFYGFLSFELNVKELILTPVYYLCKIDLAHAISLLKENKVGIPLVVFGHMHKELAHGNGLRNMIVVGADDTIYLNGAIVPRVQRLDGEGKRNFSGDETALSSSEENGTARAFTIVEISEGRVAKIAESWVSVVQDRTTLEEEHILFESC